VVGLALDSDTAGEALPDCRGAGIAVHRVATVLAARLAHAGHDNEGSNAALNGGEVLVETLVSRGVEAAFFVPGGTYVTVLEALSRKPNAIRSIATRLESSAVFAAETYAALARRPACVFVSRAPGATNAAIGIHTAMQASRPLVLFVANIPRGLKQREAFQEIDYQGMYGPVAKAVFDVQSFADIPRVTARALDLAVTGRPGPVVVSISKDVLDGETGEPALPPAYRAPLAGPDPAALEQVVALLDEARHPLILAGEMIAWEGGHAALAALAEASGAGVLGAYRQQDVLDNTHPAWLGQLTLNRTAHIEEAMASCDLLLSLGCRMDSVTTGDYAPLPAGQALVMVHPEPTVFAAWQPRVAMASHTVSVMQALAGRVRAPDAARLGWRDALHQAEVAGADPAAIAVHGEVNLAQVIRHFQRNVPEDTILISDAGTFGRWLHRFHVHRHPDTSLGPVSGAMGYGVPGGIGAAVAQPGRTAVVWVGDGGFLMTGHEAAVIVQEQLPVKIMVCDNSAWGSILIHQQKRFPGWDFATRLRSPDFATLAKGYGMPAFSVPRTDAFPEALAQAMAVDGPALVHLHLDARDISPYAGAALAGAKD
jgi:acetolactate synthase-1/2/3 large subunit